MLAYTFDNHGRVQLGQIATLLRFDTSLASLQTPLHLIELILGDGGLVSTVLGQITMLLLLLFEQLLMMVHVDCIIVLMRATELAY